MCGSIYTRSCTDFLQELVTGKLLSKLIGVANKVRLCEVKGVPVQWHKVEQWYDSAKPLNFDYWNIDWIHVVNTLYISNISAQVCIFFHFIQIKLMISATSYHHKRFYRSYYWVMVIMLQLPTTGYLPYTTQLHVKPSNQWSLQHVEPMSVAGNQMSRNR